MLKYITDIEYETLLGADSIPDNLDNLIIRASSYINLRTFGRINPNNVPDVVKYTTCLIIDLIKEAEEKISEIGNLKSQNIEGWSETYATPEEINKKLEEDKYFTLKQYLHDVIGEDGNYLLYRGG